MRVLVTGGAGYIGSHAVRALLRGGHEVSVLDNLHRGHAESVPAGVQLHRLDIRATERVEQVLREGGIECVMHFAALAYVGESVRQPLDYYDNNTAGSASLLRAMLAAGVKRMVFSSTCATYGEPAVMPIVESMPQSPINPYGWSKLFVERMLRDVVAAEPSFAFAAPRYFNVAGCALDGSVGEHHEPETHLIPVILQAALGKREKVTVFGDDYPTPDGTCIRDYIHVDDLVDAHIVAMQALTPGTELFLNLGIGRGLSVKEIIDTVRAVTGRSFRVEVGPRRAGDPPELYSNPERIRRELGWTAKITDVRRIVESAWTWMCKHPDGYRSEGA
jgi:UDP-glucose 4-epimerase